MKYGNPLQYSCLKNLQGRLVGYNPWDHKESDMTEVTEHACVRNGIEKQ